MKHLSLSLLLMICINLSASAHYLVDETALLKTRDLESVDGIAGIEIRFKEVVNFPKFEKDSANVLFQDGNLSVYADRIGYGRSACSLLVGSDERSRFFGRGFKKGDSIFIRFQNYNIWKNIRYQTMFVKVPDGASQKSETILHCWGDEEGLFSKPTEPTFKDMQKALGPVEIYDLGTFKSVEEYFDSINQHK